ncbi:MAG: plastocyanin/azurin family copper-binding protein [Nanoarchaeota archaeon]
MNLNIIAVLLIILMFSGCAPEETIDVTISDASDPDNKVTGEVINVTEESNTEKSDDEDAAEITDEEPVADAGFVDNISDDEIVEQTSTEIVIIDDLKFKPQQITVDKGTTVKWVHNDQYANNQNIIHQIGLYKHGTILNARSGRLSFGDIYNYTFIESGEYYYIDIVFKDKMRGYITVE